MTSTRIQVYVAIDSERDYQNALGADRTDGQQHTVGDYLVMLDHYLRRAVDQWTANPGDLEARHEIRKIAAIAVRCLEDHGAPLRDSVAK